MLVSLSICSGIRVKRVEANQYYLIFDMQKVSLSNVKSFGIGFANYEFNVGFICGKACVSLKTYKCINLQTHQPYSFSFQMEWL